MQIARDMSPEKFKNNVVGSCKNGQNVWLTRCCIQ